MAERRIFNPDDLDGVIDTSHVSVSHRVREEIDGHIETGKFVIKERGVFYHDPEMGVFSASDTCEVNLDGGYIEMKPPEGDPSEPVIAPINLEPLAYLRQLANWKPSQG